MSAEAFSLDQKKIEAMQFEGNRCLDRQYTSLPKLVRDTAAFCIRIPKKMEKFDLLKTTTTLKSDIGIPKVVCRRIRMIYFDWVGESLITCLMNRSTTIDFNNTRVDDDSEARVLYLSENKNIFYLPVDLYKNLPTVMIIDGSSCSIKTLGPENLRNLKFLKILSMSSNQLESIPKGTFKGLISLKLISLCKWTTTAVAIPDLTNVFPFKLTTKSNQSPQTFSTDS